MKKQQILYIGGGEALENIFDTDYMVSRLSFVSDTLNYNPFIESTPNWKKNLPKDLGDDYEVIKMLTPNPSSALYNEWKIALEKTLEFLDEEIYILGHSLGTIFILKYLSENVSQKITKLFLVGTPLENTAQEILGSFKIKDQKLLVDNIPKVLEKNIYFYASKDDDIVNFSDFKKYQNIFPEAHFRAYEDLGHFNEVERIEEILVDMKR